MVGCGGAEWGGGDGHVIHAPACARARTHSYVHVRSRFLAAYPHRLSNESTHTRLVRDVTVVPLRSAPLRCYCRRSYPRATPAQRSPLHDVDRQRCTRVLARSRSPVFRSPFPTGRSCGVVVGTTLSLSHASPPRMSHPRLIVAVIMRVRVSFLLYPPQSRIVHTKHARGRGRARVSNNRRRGRRWN